MSDSFTLLLPLITWRILWVTEECKIFRETVVISRSSGHESIGYARSLACDIYIHYFRSMNKTPVFECPGTKKRLAI